MTKWQTGQKYGLGPNNAKILSVFAKCTYTVQPEMLPISEQQLPIYAADRYFDTDDLLHSDLVLEGDLVPYKPTTDVVITGFACAPRGKQAYHLECKASVGPLKKTVIVYGERTIVRNGFSGFSFSDPTPFDRFEFSYNHAYGGTAQTKEGVPFPYPPNSIGEGFAIKGGFADFSELIVPNLEDPFSPVTPEALVINRNEDWQSAPKPASFGWVRQDFYPRSHFLTGMPPMVDGGGNISEQWSSLVNIGSKAYDLKFCQGASEGLWGQLLSGDELVSLSYFDPDFPKLEFSLPTDKPEMSIDFGEGAKVLNPVLQTVSIDMTDRLLSMLWRGHITVPDLDSLNFFETSVK